MYTEPESNVYLRLAAVAETSNDPTATTTVTPPSTTTALDEDELPPLIIG